MARIGVILFLGCLCFLHAPLLCRGDASSKFQVLHGGHTSMVDTDPISSPWSRSLTECASLCATAINCYSFEYDPRLRRCRLYDVPTGSVVDAPSAYFSIYVLV